MLSKKIRSAIAVVMAGTVVTAMPAVSSVMPCLENHLSITASAVSEGYYNMLSSVSVPDGEYVFYHPYSKAVMTDRFNADSGKILSEPTNGLEYSVNGSAIPAKYRYQIKSAGNGSYYILNHENKYLDIVKYNTLGFTSTPTAFVFENYDDGGVVRSFIKKKMDNYYYTISFNSSGYVTAYDHRKGSDTSQILTLLKYDSKPATYTLKKLSDYGIQNYDKNNEFTPERNGDMYAYTVRTLKMSHGLTDRVSTGIWASPGETLKVYVQSEPGDMKPSIEFTQHISHESEHRSIQLKGGVNEITVPQLHDNFNDYELPTEPGGCIYILNPYDEGQQGENVKIYIEGGDRIPVFRKGDNVLKFVAQLKDYYSHYQNGDKGYHNVAELVSDHTIFTLTLEEVYEGYVTNGLDPQSVAESWDSYMESLFRFDGLSPEEYKNFVVHVKLNQVSRSTDGSEAYAYASSGFLGIRNDTEMPAFAMTTHRRSWAYTHETGHLLDINQREYQEVTNNMWSMEYVLKNETDYDIAIKKPLDYLKLLAANEETELWSGYVGSVVVPCNPMALNMFWDLEVYHNGYWKELDTLYRNGSSGNATADSYIKNMSKEEIFTLYSSKAVGIDLTYYFKRYGFIRNPSQAYLNAISALSLSKAQPKIWYYDDKAYLKGTNSNVGKSGFVTCSADNQSDSIFFNISENYKDAHLGFEIVKNGKVVDFVWDLKYTSKDIYGSEYTINAYDRSLNVYKTVNYKVTTYPQQYPFYNGTASYSDLQFAINDSPDGSTISFSSSLAINKQIVIDGKNITLVQKDTAGKTVIFNNVSSDVFVIKNGGSLTIKSCSPKDGMLVFDGGKKVSGSLFSVERGSSLTIEKGIMVTNFVKNGNGSVICANGATVNLKGCIMEYNASNYGTVYLGGGTVLNASDETLFRQNKANYAGSALYISSSDDIAYLRDAIMYQNFSNNKDTGSTVYVNAGTICVESGTAIYANESDSYDLNTAMYISSAARAEFSGDLMIYDNVTTAGKIYIDPQITGILNIRSDSSFTTAGNVIAVPLSGSFGNDIFDAVKYNHNSFNFKNNGSSLMIAEKMPLENKSSVSKTTITLGDTVTVKAASSGGTGPCTYAIYYKQSSGSKWTVKQDFKANKTVSIKPADAAVYDICVKVKDSTGEIVKKYFHVTVKPIPLAVSASVSSSSIMLGNSVTVKANASGGTGTYQYAFYYKKDSNTKWTVKQDFKANNTVSIQPANAAAYSICAKVKDKSGTIEKQYIPLTVYKNIENKSTVSASSIQSGNSVKVSCSASGGSGFYNYAVYYKKTSDSKWTVKQSYQSNTSVTITPAKIADYEICVKAKDSDGNESKKYFKLSVTAAALSNNSKISSENISVSQSVKVTASASGGTAPYTYAFYYKAINGSSWTKKQDFSSNSSVSIKFSKPDTYNICAKVKDQSGTIVKKYFTVTVTK